MHGSVQVQVLMAESLCKQEVVFSVSQSVWFVLLQFVRLCLSRLSFNLLLFPALPCLRSNLIIGLCHTWQLCLYRFCVNICQFVCALFILISVLSCSCFSRMEWKVCSLVWALSFQFGFRFWHCRFKNPENLRISSPQFQTKKLSKHCRHNS